MNLPKQCDIVVIGGGPAGSLAATFLSQKGYEVVLFDKARHPRYNVGESVLPHVWRYCDLAKVSDKLEAEGFLQKSGGTAIWDGVIRQMAFKDFGYTRPALHVERDRFDHILLENSRVQGAQVFEGVAALGAELNNGDQVRVKYRVADDETPGTVSCRFVVDASGQGAVISRQLGLRVVDEEFRFMSVWGYFKDSKYVASGGRVYPFEKLREIPPTTFVSSIENWGWVWHIPLRESTSVGLVIPLDQMRTVKSTDESLEPYFVRRCQEIPYLNRLLESAVYCEGSLHVIRDYSYRPTKLAGPGFFLIGDAAAFVDPIFSVGVSLGMYSAYLASWAIDRSFRDSRRVEKNQSLFSKQYLSRLEVSRALALPRYGGARDGNDLAKQSIQFESLSEQELMSVASTITTRNENFVEIAQSREGQEIASQKFQILEEIIF